MKRMLGIGAVVAALLLPQDANGLMIVPCTATTEHYVETTENVTYRVQEGDTLWDIAEEKLGDPYRFSELAEFNSLPDANLINTGMELRLPEQYETKFLVTHTNPYATCVLTDGPVVLRTEIHPQGTTKWDVMAQYK